MGEGSVVNFVGISTPSLCPKGHRLIVEDRYYDGDTGLLSLFTSDGLIQFVPKLREIIEDVQRGQTSPSVGLHEAVNLMPPGSLAFIEKLGSHDPLTILLLLWQVISGAMGFAADTLTVHQAAVPSNPPAQTIINNYNTTNVYPPAPQQPTSKPIPSPTKKVPSVRCKKRLAKHQCRAEWNPKHKASSKPKHP